MSIRRAQQEFLESDLVVELGEERSQFTEAKFDNIMSTLNQLAVLYIDLITDYADKYDVSSSGKMQDSIKPTEVEVEGDVYSIGIMAPDYASYQDEGVSGFANNRGSRFKFKNGGTPDSMVKSVKEWLQREGQSARNVKVAVAQRESKGKKVTDYATSKAKSVAYMIKRQGFEGKHFWRDATNDFEKELETEFAKALKIDIIKNIV